jgi:hypothetical protein
MLFGKRRWAVRVIKAASLKVGSPAAVEVVDLLVQGAKAAERLAGDHDRHLDDLDFIAQTARALVRDDQAADRLTSRIGIGPEEAARTLKAAADAADSLFQAEGREPGAPRPGRVREPWKPGG